MANHVTYDGGIKMKKLITILIFIFALPLCAHAQCPSEKALVVKGVTEIKEKAYYGCNKLTSLVIEDGVTTIGAYAFYGCFSLTSVVIPDSVTSIGEWAFYGCNGIKDIKFSSKLKSIGEMAFYGCNKLPTNVELPASVDTVSPGAFYGTKGVTSKAISIPTSASAVPVDAFKKTTTTTVKK
jgi:hypothetical protein